MTELTFAGAGAAFTIDNYQSNMVITSPSGKHLLVDCGSDIRHSLRVSMGLSATDIDAVYISHLHADHIGGLEWLAFSTFFNPVAKKPSMFINRKLAQELWENSLRGGLGSIEGTITDLNTYFDVVECPKNGTFSWEGTEFRLVQVVHYMDGYNIVPSYGLQFEVDGKQYFITTDTQFNPNQIKKFYDDADIIFQDTETTPFKSGVHAHYTELVTLPDEIKQKMWLYHYADGDKPDCIKDGFLGWVQNGQKFDL